MKKDIKDYLHLYLGCEVIYGDDDTSVILNAGELETLYTESIKPILRPLSDMTIEEAEHFAWLVMDNPHLKEESYRVSLDEVQVESAHNDGGTLLDDNIDFCIVVNVRCYEGTICFYKDGAISLLDENGQHERPLHDIAGKIKWLLSKHFDLFGLCEAGLAIDKTNQQSLKQ